MSIESTISRFMVARDAQAAALVAKGVEVPYGAGFEDFPLLMEDIKTDSCCIQVSGASVGQVLEVSAVDEQGVPTAWQTANKPSGGNSALVKADELIAEGVITTGSKGLVDTGMTWGQLKAYKEFALLIASVGGNTNFPSNSTYWRIKCCGGEHYGLPALCKMAKDYSGAVALIKFLDDEKKILSYITLSGTAYAVRTSDAFTSQTMFAVSGPTSCVSILGDIGYTDLSKVKQNGVVVEVSEDSPIVIYFSGEAAADYEWKALGVFK